MSVVGEEEESVKVDEIEQINSPSDNSEKGAAANEGDSADEIINEAVANDIPTKDALPEPPSPVPAEVPFQTRFDDFCTEISKGNIELVSSTTFTSAELDSQNSDGKTPLILSIVFDYPKIMEILLQKGVSVNGKDIKGKDPMRWAKSTGNSAAIDLLVEYGAPPSSPALSKRTSILSQSSSKSNHQPTEIDTAPQVQAKVDVAPAPAPKENDSVENILTPTESTSEEVAKSSTNMSTRSSSSTLNTDTTVVPEDNSPFDWTASPPRNQDMYPFEIDHIGHILNVTIRTIVPKRSKKFAPLGGNVLFLCARYAAYKQSPDLADGFLKSSIGAIKLWLRSNEEMQVQMYWLSNCLQLLIYIKRDSEMVKSTRSAQKELKSLCSDILVDIFSQIELEIDAMAVSALIDYQADESKLEMDFFGFAKRTSRFKKMDYLQSLSQLGCYLPTTTKATPSDIFEMFANILALCKANAIHPSLKLQIFSKIFAKITKILFLKITCTRNLCCRSRAQQIQMNLSLITDWIHEHASSFSNIQVLLKQFFPLRQLLQFIQVVSTTRQVSDFKNVMEMFHLTNKCVYVVMANYRYETGEQSFPAVVESYVISLYDENEEVWKEDEIVFVIPEEKDDSEYWTVDPSVPPLVKEMVDAGTKYLPRKISKLEESDPNRSPPVVIMEEVGE